MSISQDDLEDSPILEPIFSWLQETDEGLKGISVSINGEKLRPVVLETETNGTAEVTTYTDQCGNQEADQTSSGNAQHTIDALLYADSLERVYRLYQTGAKVDLTLPADLDVVGLFITDLAIKQNGDTVSFVNEEGLDEPVWRVQIQLKSSGAIDEESG